MRDHAKQDEKIDLYLTQVRSRLRGISEDNVSEILQELHSHIIDSAGSAGTISEASLTAAIESLGRPEEIASEYVAGELFARAQALRLPWILLQAVFHWATVSLGGVVVLIFSAFGYLLGAAFLLCAALKPFDPSGVGLWIRRHPFGLSLLVGAPDQGPQAHELLGWWIIPVGIVVGVFLFLLTTQFGLWSIHHFQRLRKLNSNR